MMSEVYDPFDPPKAAARPSQRAAQRDLQMQATRSGLATDAVQRRKAQADLAKAPIDLERARLALKYDEETTEAQAQKALAEARRAQIDSEEAERGRTKPGKLGVLPGASETKLRLGLGFGPAISAQMDMFKEEGWDTGKGRNPFLTSGRNTVAKLTESIPMTGLIGDSSFRRYQQAAKSWESALLPIFSGQAVTVSEAMRQIKGRLPAPDDTPDILRRKSKERAMMLNAAADLLGQERPFPWLGIIPIGEAQAKALKADPALGAPKTAPKEAKIPEGMTPEQVLAQAKKAIASGKDRAGVIAKVKSMGIDPKGL